MAARPKSVDALIAIRHALNNVEIKLTDIANKAERVIAENPHLEAGEIVHYKACAKAASKQLTVLGKLAAVELPTYLTLGNATTAAPKRRGRPPKAKAAATEATSTPKRRGRPPKIHRDEDGNVIEAAPKRRGRPPKAKHCSRTYCGNGGKAQDASRQDRDHRCFAGQGREAHDGRCSSA